MNSSSPCFQYYFGHFPVCPDCNCIKGLRLLITAFSRLSLHSSQSLLPLANATPYFRVLWQQHSTPVPQSLYVIYCCIANYTKISQLKIRGIHHRKRFWASGTQECPSWVVLSQSLRGLWSSCWPGLHHLKALLGLVNLFPCSPMRLLAGLCSSLDAGWNLQFLATWASRCGCWQHSRLLPVEWLI